MSYEKQGNLMSFFVPVMAVAANATKPLATIDIGASSADHGEYVCVRPCFVNRVQAAVTIEAVSGTTTAPTVIFTKRTAYAVSSGEAVIGTLTLPSGTAIGKTVYKDITPVAFAVGEIIELSHTVGVGTPTGMVNADVLAEFDPEIAGNNSNMIASA